MTKDSQAEVAQALKNKFKQPAALTIYCDYMNINFWRGLQHAGKPYLTDLQKQPENQSLTPAADLVVQEATKFFRLLFDTHYVPQPVLTSARIWSGSFSFSGYNAIQEARQQANKGGHWVENLAPAPSKKKAADQETLMHQAGAKMVNPLLGEQVGYGVHQWALGANDRLTIAALVNPAEGLYVCGEAFSDYQGWVEGALRSANLVLEKMGLLPLKETKAFKKAFPGSVEEVIQARYWEHRSERVKHYFNIDIPAQTDETDSDSKAPMDGRHALQTPMNAPLQTTDHYGIDLTMDDYLKDD